MKNKIKIVIDVTKHYLRSYNWKEQDIKENKQIFSFLIIENTLIKKNKKCSYCNKEIKNFGVKGDVQTIILKLKEFWDIEYLDYINKFKQMKIKSKKVFCSDKCFLKELKKENVK